MIKETLIALVCSIMITNYAGECLIREAINVSEIDRACILIASEASLEDSPASACDFFGTTDCIISAMLLKRAQLFGGSLGEVYVVDLRPNCTSARIRGTVADSLTDADIKHRRIQA